MEKIKIIPKFFSKAQASQRASEERQLLKAQGKNKTHKVEILFAHEFWRTNKWFNQKKFGLANPTDQDYIIIITEISKSNTIYMYTTRQKQPQKISTGSKSLKTQSFKKKTLPTTEVHKAISCPIQCFTTITYPLLRIPTPFFYHSVA